MSTNLARHATIFEGMGVGMTSAMHAQQRLSVDKAYSSFHSRRGEELSPRGFALRERTREYDLYASIENDGYCHLPADPKSHVSPFLVYTVPGPQMKKMVEDYTAFSYNGQSKIKIPVISAAIGLALGLGAAPEFGLDVPSTLALGVASTTLGTLVGVAIDQIRRSSLCKKQDRFHEAMNELEARGYRPVIGKDNILDYFNVVLHACD